jgi:uncharacterized OB-fold protein
MSEPAVGSGRPEVVPDEGAMPLFEGAAAGVLRIKRCTACNTWLVPAAQLCMNCLADEIEWADASGEGKLHSFGIVHQLYHPGFKDEIPYNIAVVELAEGPRINSNVVGCENSELRVGMPLRATFVATANGVVIPKFKPA